MNFTVKNCRVSVNFYFFALICAAAFFDRSGVMQWGLLAALLHECGHLAAMLLIPGQSPGKISITPFGMKIENSPLSEFARGNSVVLAAGSVVNLLSAAVTFGIQPDFAAVSLVLGMMNLLPVEGMDGGGLLRNIIEGFLPPSSAGRVMNYVTWTTLGAMFLLGLYVLIATGYNISLLGAAAMLALARKRSTRP